MIAAAATVGETSPTPLFVELEEILGSFVSFARPAQRAVAAVVESLIVERNLSEAERGLATALLVLATVSRCGLR